MQGTPGLPALLLQDAAIRSADRGATVIFGIDPGLTGACAALSSKGVFYDVTDLPRFDDGCGFIDSAGLRDWMMQRIYMHTEDETTSVVVLERQHAMPKQGVTSSFQIGVTYGCIMGALLGAKWQTQMVRAHVWKKKLSLAGGAKEKYGSLDKARLLYPTAALDRKKDHNRAEALLLAHWWFAHGTSAR